MTKHLLMKRMNGIIEHRPELKKDQQIVSGSDEVAAALKKMKRQSPRLLRASSGNDTDYRRY